MKMKRSAVIAAALAISTSLIAPAEAAQVESHTAATNRATTWYGPVKVTTVNGMKAYSCAALPATGVPAFTASSSAVMRVSERMRVRFITKHGFVKKTLRKGALACQWKVTLDDTNQSGQPGGTTSNAADHAGGNDGASITSDSLFMMPSISLVKVVTPPKISTDDAASFSNLTVGFSVVDEFTYTLSGGTFQIWNGKTQKADLVRGEDYTFTVLTGHDGMCTAQLSGGGLLPLNGQGKVHDLALDSTAIPGFDPNRTDYASCNYTA